MQAAKAIFGLLRETVAEWSEDKAPRLGAALAYYTVFSLAPLLIIAVVISAAFFGEADAQAAILAQVQSIIGRAGAEAVGRMIDSARLPREAGVATTAIGAASLLLGALGAFSQLQDAFNTIWEVTPKPGQGLVRIIQIRVISFAMVLVVGFLLLVSLIINAVLTAMASYLENRLPNFALLATSLNLVLPLVVATVLFAVMFKVLPDVDLGWRDVWVGAILTSILFTLGKNVLGFYLGSSRIGTAYGAAGSVLIILTWVYYSAQILFFGAEFTQVYVRRHRHKQAQPTENAVPVTEAERLHQGMPRTQPAAPASVPARPRPAMRGLRRPVRDFTGPLLGFVAGVGAGIVVAVRTLKDS
jgi:membrane protein